MRAWWTRHRSRVTTVALAILAMWITLRTERAFTQAWNDYQDFKVMRAWILQQSQRPARPPQ